MRPNRTPSYIRLQIVGLNFSKFLDDAKKQNCTIYQWVKTDGKTNELSLAVSDYKKLLKARSFRSFTVHVKKQTGFYFFIKNLKAEIGLISGIATAMILFVFLSLFTFHINITGNEFISNADIVQALSDHGVKIGKINNATNEEMESYLKQEFEDISLVSVIKQGTNIVISVKEKEKLDLQVTGLYADTNMFIESIIVSQGTAMVQKGDMVLKGALLVAPYQKNNKGEKIDCSPVATITCQAWYVGQVEYETKEIKQVKTGKKTITQSSFSLFGKTFWQTSKTQNYQLSTTVSTTMQLFKNSFIPIVLNQTIVYECTQKVVLHDFEKEKNSCIAKSKTLAQQVFPAGETVLQESVVISPVGTIMLVQTVLYTERTINSASIS